MKTVFGPKLAGFDLSLISSLRNHYEFFEVTFNGSGPNASELAKAFPSEKFVVHAPHHKARVNMSLSRESNIQLVEDAINSACILGASKVVVHPGLEGKKENLTSNLSNLSKKAEENGIKILLEVIPIVIEGTQLKSTLKSVDDYFDVVKEAGCGFCLDFSHAAHFACSLGEDYKSVFRCFEKLKPDHYHLYDTDVNSPYDVHFNFSEGNMDTDYCLSLVNGQCTLELPKENALENYQDARKFLIRKGF